MSKIQQKEVLPEEVAIELNYDCNKDCYFCFNKVNAKKGKGFVEQIKGRNDIELIEVTRENRDHLAEEIARRIKKELGS